MIVVTVFHDFMPSLEIALLHISPVLVTDCSLLDFSCWVVDFLGNLNYKGTRHAD